MKSIFELASNLTLVLTKPDTELALAQPQLVLPIFHQRYIILPYILFRAFLKIIYHCQILLAHYPTFLITNFHTEQLMMSPNVFIYTECIYLHTLTPDD